MFSRARSLIPAILLVAALGACVPVAQSQSDGVRVGEMSRIRQLVSAEEVERAAAQQYRDMMRKARQQGALAADDHPQLQRLRAIAARIEPHAARWNPRAAQWRWEVNLLGGAELNAFCMPGGKIAFYQGLLERLNLNDDEVAVIMAHEMAHALREHGRERLAKSAATELGVGLVAGLLGLGDLGRTGVSLGAQLVSLKFSRDDEVEADVVGLDLAARAGYDPRAGISLWRKMQQAGGSAPPQWLSTHPDGQFRINEIERRLPEVLPLYARTRGVPVERLPAYPG
jgi:predicted Zn-dependent protease